MKEIRNNKFPRWGFGLIAVGGLMASGIYLGIMSVEGLAVNNLVKAVGYGIVGLVMFTGVYRK